MRRAAVLLLLAALVGSPIAAGAADGAVRLAGQVLVSGVGASGIEVQVWRRAGAVPSLPLPADDVAWLHPEWLLDAALLPGPPLARTRTGEGGGFEFAGLEKGRYLVVAATPEGSRSWREVSLFVEGGVTGLRIPVVPGSHALCGRARHLDGTPHDGAVVFSYGEFDWPDDESPQILGGAICDAEGRFEVRGLPSGRVEITAVAPGRFRAPLGPVLLPCEDPLDLVVDENLAVREGTLVDTAGRPAPGVRLLARDGESYVRDTSATAGGRTDEDGRFRMLAPLDPDFRIAGSDRYLSRVDDCGTVLVALQRPRVHGVVRRVGDGAPLAGIPVLARRGADSGEPPSAVLTDAEGRFSLSAPDLEFILAAWGRGWVPRDRSEKALSYVSPDELALPTDATALRVEVIPKVAPRVTVLDADGAPLPGAVVRLDAPDTGRPFLDGRIIRTTSEDGVAALPLLRPDEAVILRVTSPDGRALPHSDWAWRPADVAIRLRRALSISGSVVDAEGRPVPDATIFVRPAAGAPPLPENFSYTRIDGGFALAAIAGPDGAFVIRGLPETTVDLFAALVHADGAETRSPPAASVAGATGLVLRLP